MGLLSSVGGFLGDVAGKALGFLGGSGVSSVIDAGASYLGSRNVNDAAANAERISEESSRLTRWELGRANEDISDWLDPFINRGKEALYQYRYWTGKPPDAPVFDEFNFDYTKMEDNPAYQFVRDQGLRATDRIQAKNRNLGSGNRLTAAADYATGLASTEYENEFQRQLQAHNANQKTIGLNYEGQTDQYGRRMNNLGQLMTQGSNATTNRAGFEERFALDKSRAWQQLGSNKVAANLLETKGKNNFLDSLANLGGTLAGKL